MKVSEITTSDLVNYLKVEESEATGLKVFLDSAKSYIKSYTGLDDTEIDTHHDIVPVVFVLVSDMYENREYMVQNDKVNKLVQSTLDMYCINLL